MLTMSTWDLFRWHETYWNLTVLICLPLTFCFMRFPNCVFHCLSPACQQCPAGSEPTLGYEYKWWNVLPSNMKTSCFNVGNSKCDSMNGRCLWQDMPTFALSLNSGLFCHCIVWWLQWSESKSMANIWLPLATRTNRNTHTTLTATLTPRPPHPHGPPPPPTPNDNNDANSSSFSSNKLVNCAHGEEVGRFIFILSKYTRVHAVF